MLQRTSSTSVTSSAPSRVLPASAESWRKCSRKNCCRKLLNLNAASFENCRISVIQAITASPSLLIDRHKVLTILVNLLCNAKQALLAHERTDKRLILRAASEGADFVRINIEDNGIGIAPEYLPDIFRLGFTTKKDGHGFGLHSCAVTAQELGGALTVQSPGIGKGATFTLCLPLARPLISKSSSPEIFPTPGNRLFVLTAILTVSKYRSTPRSSLLSRLTSNQSRLCYHCVMIRRDYLIIGAGVSGASVCEGIREHDKKGSIMLVGNEIIPAYHRPLLFKNFLNGKIPPPVEVVQQHDIAWFQENN